MALTLPHAFSRLSLFHQNSQITSITDSLRLKTTWRLPNTRYAPLLATAQPLTEGTPSKSLDFHS